MMDQSSKEVRKQFKILNKRINWFRSVSRTALLKDRKYSLPTPEEFINDVSWAIDQVKGAFIPEAFDCDDFSGCVCSFVKLRRMEKILTTKVSLSAYPIFPCALHENHTIVICVTTQGIWFAEPQTGECWSLKDRNMNVIFIG